MKERIEKTLAEIELLFLDAEHWNQSHPDEEPIDCDPDGELKRLQWRLSGMFKKLKGKDSTDPLP